jgi:hypothetical protein
MLGEPEYDVPSFLWNPLPYRMRLDLTERRLAAFAAAGLDEQRMRAWGSSAARISALIRTRWRSGAPSSRGACVVQS